MAQKQSLADLGKVEAIRQLFESLPFRLKEGKDYIAESFEELGRLAAERMETGNPPWEPLDAFFLSALK